MEEQSAGRKVGVLETGADFLETGADFRARAFKGAGRWSDIQKGNRRSIQFLSQTQAEWFWWHTQNITGDRPKSEAREVKVSLCWYKIEEGSFSSYCASWADMRKLAERESGVKSILAKTYEREGERLA